MSYVLGVDTGGTYTDAVILDEAADKVVASAKALTSRPDLAVGVGAAIDAALDQAGVAPDAIAMVSLSTTLATNALVEGQGGRVALVAIGFDEGDLSRAGLADAMRGDPVIRLSGGHNHAGGEKNPFDEDVLKEALAGLEDGITGFAVAAAFATRNPAHELRARDVIRETTGLPVSWSHDLSRALGGPKRALTAVLNARLIGMIDRLITACEGHLAARGIAATVVRTNVRTHPLVREMSWERAHGGILAGVGHVLGGAVRRVLISSSISMRSGRPWGSHFRLDPMWGSARRSFLSVGGCGSRGPGPRIDGPNDNRIRPHPTSAPGLGPVPGARAGGPGAAPRAHAAVPPRADRACPRPARAGRA